MNWLNLFLIISGLAVLMAIGWTVLRFVIDVAGGGEGLYFPDRSKSDSESAPVTPPSSEPDLDSEESKEEKKKQVFQKWEEMWRERGKEKAKEKRKKERRKKEEGKKKKKEKEKEKKSDPIPPLQMRVRIGSKNLLGQPAVVFVVEVKGQRISHTDDDVLEAYLHIFDDGLNFPAWSTVEERTEQFWDSKVFQLRIQAASSPYMFGHGHLSDWQVLGEIPVSQLEFPVRGMRTLQFYLTSVSVKNGRNSFENGILTKSTNRTYGVIKTKIPYAVGTQGYLYKEPIDKKKKSEDKKKKKKSEKKIPAEYRPWLLIQGLAIHVAHLRVSTSEKDRAIKGWLEKKLDSIESKSIRSRTKRQIQVELIRGWSRGKHKRWPSSQSAWPKAETDVPSLCANLVKCEEKYRYQALDLCFEVVEADGKASTVEFTELNKIASAMGIPWKKYRDKVTKWILKLGEEGVRNINRSVLLDVAYGTQPESERSERLLNETRIWVHFQSDSKFRNLANYMLMIIGRFRDDLSLEIDQSRQTSTELKRIYVGNLSFSWGEEEVRELFSAYGEVYKVDLINDRATGRPRGFGFVEMDADNADAAIGALNGQEHGGRVLRVNESPVPGRGDDE